MILVDPCERERHLAPANGKGNSHITFPFYGNNDSISRPNSQPKLPFPGNGKGNYKMPREEKFEACIPGNHGKREFPLTPGTKHIFSASYEEIFFGQKWQYRPAGGKSEEIHYGP